VQTFDKNEQRSRNEFIRSSIISILRNSGVVGGAIPDLLEALTCPRTLPQTGTEQSSLLNNLSHAVNTFFIAKSIYIDENLFIASLVGESIHLTDELRAKKLEGKLLYHKFDDNNIWPVLPFYLLKDFKGISQNQKKLFSSNSNQGLRLEERVFGYLEVKYRAIKLFGSKRPLSFVYPGIEYYCGDKTDFPLFDDIVCGMEHHQFSKLTSKTSISPKWKASIIPLISPNVFYSPRKGQKSFDGIDSISLKHAFSGIPGDWYSSLQIFIQIKALENGTQDSPNVTPSHIRELCKNLAMCRAAQVGCLLHYLKQLKDPINLDILQKIFQHTTNIQIGLLITQKSLGVPPIPCQVYTQKKASVDKITPVDKITIVELPKTRILNFIADVLNSKAIDVRELKVIIEATTASQKYLADISKWDVPQYDTFSLYSICLNAKSGEDFSLRMLEHLFANRPNSKSTKTMKKAN